jgi:type I restriction-modification system DNA methylase subunit
MLPLMFFKRLSDAYLEEYEELLRKYGDEEIAKTKFHRFTIPDGCLWEDVRRQSQNATTTETAVSIRISERNTSTWLSLSSQASD